MRRLDEGFLDEGFLDKGWKDEGFFDEGFLDKGAKIFWIELRKKGITLPERRIIKASTNEPVNQ